MYTLAFWKVWLRRKQIMMDILANSNLGALHQHYHAAADDSGLLMAANQH
jgi:hypothetical protein